MSPLEPKEKFLSTLMGFCDNFMIDWEVDSLKLTNCWCFRLTFAFYKVFMIIWSFWIEILANLMTLWASIQVIVVLFSLISGNLQFSLKENFNFSPKGPIHKSCQTFRSKFLTTSPFWRHLYSFFSLSNFISFFSKIPLPFSLTQFMDVPKHPKNSHNILD